jgi:hypothetical protein
MMRRAAIRELESPMKHAVVAVALLAAVLSVFPERASGQQPGEYPAAGAPPIIRVLSTGAAPKAALRYTPPAGMKQRIDMTMIMGVSMEMSGAAGPGMTLPAIKMGADCVVTGVAPSGDVTYTVAFTGAEGDPGGNPQIASTIQSMNDALKSVKGSATVSNRGVTLVSNIDFSKVADSSLGQSMGSTTDQMKVMAIPLPEEELGVGARWEAYQTFVNSGMTMYQKSELELVAVDGRTVTLKAKVEQTAPPQAISNPALPPGAEVHLDRLTGVGTADIKLNLNELVPVSDAAMDTTMLTSVAMGGNAMQVAMNVSMKLTVAPGK